MFISLLGIVQTEMCLHILGYFSFSLEGYDKSIFLLSMLAEWAGSSWCDVRAVLRALDQSGPALQMLLLPSSSPAVSLKW